MGCKLLLTRSGDPRRALEKQTVGTVTASHKMLTLQALSSSLNADTAERGCLGRGEAFGYPPAVCPPKRPRPFAHYHLTENYYMINSETIMDVNNYTPFSRINSQRIDAM